jgi:hypothetical protein
MCCFPVIYFDLNIFFFPPVKPVSGLRWKPSG